MNIKQRNLIIIVVSLLTTFVVFFLVIKPTIAYILNTKDQIKAQREELEKRYQRIMYLRKNVDKLKEIEEQLVVLNDLFLMKGEEVEFITTLESIADKNNIWQKINLKEININDPAQTTLPFGVTAVGKIHNMITYLLDMEQLKYYINFNSINIVSQTASKSSIPNEKELKVQVEGEIHLLKNPQN
jgi:Tfp pilus assembly protein PilO